MNNLITFLSNFRYFKKYLWDEIKRKTAERLIRKKINEFVVNQNTLNSKSTLELLEKYKKLIEK
jgi:hypothetical protein